MIITPFLAFTILQKRSKTWKTKMLTNVLYVQHPNSQNIQQANLLKSGISYPAKEPALSFCTGILTTQGTPGHLWSKDIFYKALEFFHSFVVNK